MSASGYFLSANWIAVQSSVEKIVSVLDLKNPQMVSLEEGWGNVHMNERDAFPNSILITSEINSYRLIVGSQLNDLDLSTCFVKKLSSNSGRVFSFGIDLWCAYCFWMYAENGELKRYYQEVDTEVQEYGKKQEFEKGIHPIDSESIFELSKTFALDIDDIKREDFDNINVMLWDFR